MKKLNKRRVVEEFSTEALQQRMCCDTRACDPPTWPQPAILMTTIQRRGM